MDHMGLMTKSPLIFVQQFTYTKKTIFGGINKILVDSTTEIYLLERQ